jgi:hypothetical protein
MGDFVKVAETKDIRPSKMVAETKDIRPSKMVAIEVDGEKGMCC